VTAHPGPLPVPARITTALDAADLWGPEVDRALGGEEPMVDDWEAGRSLPTPAQVKRLAALTGWPVSWFYRPVEDSEHERTRHFVCERDRRPENALTIAESWIDWDGVAHLEVLTPPAPPRRPARPRSAAKPAAPAPTAAHHPSCPHHGTTRDPRRCGVCRSIRIGGDQ
jgi:hypothetical protein